MSATETDRPAASLDSPAAARVSAAAPRSIASIRAVVFVVGAASLGTEISAARLLAPYFGASTVIWANTASGRVRLEMRCGNQGS